MSEYLKQNLHISPCVGNCCLNSDDVCVGCFRHVEEITAWHTATDEQKIEIIDKMEERKNQLQPS